MSAEKIVCVSLCVACRGDLSGHLVPASCGVEGRRAEPQARRAKSEALATTGALRENDYKEAKRETHICMDVPKGATSEKL